MTACCDGPLGAVRLLDLPSWFTAEPLNMITWASAALVMTSTSHPSARTYPSASASSVLHLPSDASIPARWNMAVVCARRVRFTPLVTAVVHSLSQMALEPRCAATSEDEHAVSTLKAGPFRLKQNDTRPDATLKAVADALVADIGALPMFETSLYSVHAMPVYMPVDERSGTDILSSVLTM